MFQSEKAAQPLGLCPFSMGSSGLRGGAGLEAISSSKEKYCADYKRGARLGE